MAMKNILRVSASPRGQAAESYRLSQKIIDLLLQKEPGATVVNREIGDGTMPHVDENYAISQGSTADVSKDGSMILSEKLIREVERADFLVISTPMHNLSVPSSLKAWLDHVVRARRTFNVSREGKIGMLRDRPVFVAIASGGRFSGERARQPDFLTLYLKAVLATVGLHDLTFFSVQGTGSGPEATAHTRTKTDEELQAYFTSFHLTSHYSDRLRSSDDLRAL
jgi:FMN-dependent NADH-azoreductase